MEGGVGGRCLSDPQNPNLGTRSRCIVIGKCHIISWYEMSAKKTIERIANAREGLILAAGIVVESAKKSVVVRQFHSNPIAKPRKHFPS